MGFKPSEKEWGDWAADALRRGNQDPVWYGEGGISSEAALEQAKKVMSSCRAAIAFVHHRGNGHMPGGVRDELMLAINYHLPVIAFWDPNVSQDGLLGQAVIKRVPFPKSQEESIAVVQQLLAWAKDLDTRASNNALLGIAAVVGGLWLLSKLGEDGNDEENEET